MADFLVDGYTKVWWATTLSDPSAPTTAELTAAVPLEDWITPDGLDIQVNTDAVDAGALSSTQDAEIPGRRKDSITLTFKQQGQAAVPWTTFAGRADGFLVVRRDVLRSTAAAVAQKVQVYPGRAGDRQQVKPAKNEVSKFSVPIFVTAAVLDSATIA